MKTEEITALMATPKCSQADSNLKGDLVKLMMKVYTLQGKLKDVNIEILKTELNVIAEELTKNVLSRFDGLRTTEIDYAFMAGLNGDYKVETFGLNYQTFYKWIEAYYYSEERKAAINLSIQAKGLKQIEQKCLVTEKEKEEIMQMWINGDYSDYLQQTIQEPHIGVDIQKMVGKTASDERKMNYLISKNKDLGKKSIKEIYEEYRKKGEKIIFNLQNKN